MTDSTFSPDVVGVVADNGGGAGRAGRSAEDDRRVAVHEAAHAVTSRLLGLMIGGVRIDPDASGKFSGLVWGPQYVAGYSEDNPSAPSFCEQMRPMMPRAGESREDVPVAEILLHATDCIVELAAGSLGEELLLPDEPWPALHDRAQEVQYASLFCSTSESVEAFAAFGRSICRDLLRPHLGVVEDLANALLVERVMDGARVDVVIAESLARSSREVKHARREDWGKREANAARFQCEPR
jgi:hypothetical protein